MSKSPEFMKVPNIPNQPTGGVYSNSNIGKSYKALYLKVHAFMDEVDSGSGNLSVGGRGSMAVARAKELVAYAKSLEAVVIAATMGRK